MLLFLLDTVTDGIEGGNQVARDYCFTTKCMHPFIYKFIHFLYLSREIVYPSSQPYMIQPILSILSKRTMDT